MKALLQPTSHDAGPGLEPSRPTLEAIGHRGLCPARILRGLESLSTSAAGTDRPAPTHSPRRVRRRAPPENPAPRLPPSPAGSQGTSAPAFRAGRSRGPSRRAGRSGPDPGARPGGTAAGIHPFILFPLCLRSLAGGSAVNGAGVRVDWRRGDRCVRVHHAGAGRPGPPRSSRAHQARSALRERKAPPPERPRPQGPDRPRPQAGHARLILAEWALLQAPPRV